MKRVYEQKEFNGHAWGNAENFEGQHESYGYGIRKKGGKRILKFCRAMDMTAGNALFKNTLFVHESDPLKAHED